MSVSYFYFPAIETVRYITVTIKQKYKVGWDLS